MNKNIKNKNGLDFVEVLSPAGSFESLKAAICAGADAVYLGGDRFGARAFADNFDLENMKRAIDHVHLHGKQIYMTVNTLFKKQEIEELYEYLLPYYKEGLDAVIVQDVGAAALIKKEFPGLDLHASTQMTVMGVEGAAFLEELGFQRVVPARELSLPEIKAIREHTNLEIETFVHGALCYSYSGQCLMSSMLGGRSGNRGRCAQPCRLPYDLYENGKKKNKNQERYLFSPKDLCSLEILPQILEAGSNSLKIEGRMKRPEYVAAVTRQYRRYVDFYLEHRDEFRVKKEDLQELMELYNRGGFTKGYYLTHNGREMMSMKRPNHMGYYVGKIKEIDQNRIRFVCDTDIHKQDILEIALGKEEKVELTSPLDARKGSTLTLNAKRIKSLKKGMEIYRTRNQTLITSIQEDVIQREKKENLKGNITFRVGKPVMMQVWYKNLTTTVTGDEVLKAQKQPVTREKILSQLQKTGGTEFTLEITEIDMDEDAFLPMGAIKALRRKALEEIREVIIDSQRRKVPERMPKISRETSPGEPRRQVIASVTTMEQARAALNSEKVDAIYLLGESLPFERWEAFSQECQTAGKEIYYAMPYILHERARKDWKEQEALICQGSHQGIFVRTLDEFAMIRGFSDFKKTIVVSASLYAYNPDAIRFYKEHAGCKVRMTLPVELNEKELVNLKEPYADLMVYGHQPLMISAQCQTKNHLGCRKEETALTIKDRYQKDFYVRNFCRYCYNVIYNGDPLSLLSMEKELLQLHIGGYVYQFTIEDGKETMAVLEGRFGDKKYTKGHFKRGIE